MIHSFEDFSLNKSTRELKRGDETVPVEPRTFDLLCHLVENHDRVISKDELVDVVWQGRFVSDAAVSSAVRDARRALGDDGQVQHFIKTIWGHGFRFIVSSSEVSEPFGGKRSDNVKPNAAPRRQVSSDKPAIAVLPFANMSGDPTQEYFSDGVTEDIITALSRFRWLFVIASTSTFQFRDSSKKPVEVADELGVGYLVKGSVRRAGNRVRVAAQLVDAVTGSQLWGENFDRELVDTFELQDDLVQGICGALAPELARAESDRILRKAPGNWEAYDYYLKALPHVYRMTEEDTSEALSLLKSAIELDPGFDRARSLSAWLYTLRRSQGWMTRSQDEETIAVQLARQALSGDSEIDPEILWQAGYTLGFFGNDFTQSLASIDQSLALNPNSSQAWMIRGLANVFSGNAQIAAADLQKAMSLSPLDPLNYRTYFGLALSAICEEQYGKAVDWARKAVAAGPNYIPGHRALAASLALGGAMKEAKSVSKRLADLLPQSSVDDWTKITPIQDADLKEKMSHGLKLAGLPEK